MHEQKLKETGLNYVTQKRVAWLQHIVLIYTPLLVSRTNRL